MFFIAIKSYTGTLHALHTYTVLMFQWWIDASGWKYETALMYDYHVDSSSSSSFFFLVRVALY